MMIQAFFYRVWNSDAQLHLIAGRDFDTINNNLLTNDMGLVAQFPNHCKLMADSIGGYYVRLISPKGTKKILIVGFDNRAKWKKILGLSIENIIVDEANIADEQFIDECWARQVSFDNPLTIWTLNGDIPEHYIYQKYINRAKIIGDAPASIRADMDKVAKEKGWYYMHWKMKDNPVMTPQKIADAMTIYPVGSYYHTIKILGERGAPGTLIYNDYMTPDLIVDLDELDTNGRPKYVFSHYTIGVDIGASRAYNVFALLGWTHDLKTCCVVDLEVIKAVGYDKKTPLLEAFALRHVENKHINAIAVDSAEQNYIADLKGKFLKHGLIVRGSNKATIKIRMDMNIVAFSNKRTLFSKHCMKAYNAFLIAKYVEGKEGIEREDLNQEHNDIMDGIEYAQTVHLHAFISGSGR